MHIEKIKWLLCCMVLTVFQREPAISQTVPVADLAIRFSKQPEGVTRPGTSGVLTIVLENFGPSAAGSIPPGATGTILVGGQSLSFDPVHGAPVDFFSVGDDDCIISGNIPDPAPGGRLEIFHSLFFNEMDAGELVECQIGFRINSTETRDVVKTWQVFSTNDDDPVVANNFIAVVFHLGLLPTEIPTLSSSGLILFALALGVGFLVLRRQGRCAGS